MSSSPSSLSSSPLSSLATSSSLSSSSCSSVEPKTDHFLRLMTLPLLPHLTEWDSFKLPHSHFADKWLMVGRFELNHTCVSLWSVHILQPFAVGAHPKGWITALVSKYHTPLWSNSESYLLFRKSLILRFLFWKARLWVAAMGFCGWAGVLWVLWAGGVLSLSRVRAVGEGGTRMVTHPLVLKTPLVL